MMGSTLLSFTTPQPTWEQGAIGDIGVVPESGSQVENEGYHPDRLSAFLRSSLVSVKERLMGLRVEKVDIQEFNLQWSKM